MRKANPEHIRRLTNLINGSSYFQLLSMKVREIGMGYAVFEIDLDKKHLQPFGIVHGGAFASIIDTAASWAMFYAIVEQDGGMTSIDLKLNYLAPAVSGKLIAKGRQIKVGETIGYGKAEVTSETGKLLAHGTSTIMILPGKAPTADPPLPVKFLN